MLVSMVVVPYRRAIMKMTMHIDEDTLADVMKITGVPSKTRAVETALVEMVRRHKLKKLLKAGLGLSPNEIASAYDFGDEETARVAETPTRHVKRTAR